MSTIKKKTKSKDKGSGSVAQKSQSSSAINTKSLGMLVAGILSFIVALIAIGVAKKKLGEST